MVKQLVCVESFQLFSDSPESQLSKSSPSRSSLNQLKKWNSRFTCVFVYVDLVWYKWVEGSHNTRRVRFDCKKSLTVADVRLTWTIILVTSQYDPLAGQILIITYCQTHLNVLSSAGAKVLKQLSWWIRTPFCLRKWTAVNKKLSVTSATSLFFFENVCRYFSIGCSTSVEIISHTLRKRRRESP